jgi:hypothetical protein
MRSASAAAAIVALSVAATRARAADEEPGMAVERACVEAAAGRDVRALRACTARATELGPPARAAWALSLRARALLGRRTPPDPSVARPWRPVPVAHDVEPTDLEIDEAQLAARQAAALAPADPEPVALACAAALARSEPDALDRHAARLVALAPDDPRGHYYLSLAWLARGDHEAAAAALGRATTRGLSTEAGGVLAGQIAGERRYHRRLARFWTARVAAGLAWWGVWLVGVAAAGALLGRVARRTAEAERPRLTRGVDLLYSVTLALVALSELGTAVLVALLALAAAAIGIAALVATGLVAHFRSLWFVAAAAIVGAVALGRSLVPRAPEPAGRSLDRAEHPRLHAALASAARAAGTSLHPVVLVDAGARVEVQAVGRWPLRPGARPRLVLVLGAPALAGLDVDAFEALVAFEHARFAAPTRAGVRASLLLSLLRGARAGLEAYGPRRWALPGYWLLRVLAPLAERAARGAAVLQDAVARERALGTYDAAALARGRAHREAAARGELGTRRDGDAAGLFEKEPDGTATA